MANIFIKIVLFILSPISKIVAFFHIPDSDTTTEEFEQIKSLIKNGDCLVSRDKYALSNIFMPGEWKHAAIYLDGYIYEAVTSGLRKTSLEEFFYKKDFVGLCRYAPLSIAQVEYGKQFLNGKLGKKYDWDFSLSNDDRYYCSELCYLFYCYLFENFHLKFKMSKYFKQDVIRPTDMWKNLTQIKRW